MRGYSSVALWVFLKFREIPEFAEAVDSPMLADMGRETVYCWFEMTLF